VAPHPLPPGTLSGRGGWWTPADASDIALSEAAAEFRTVSYWGEWAAPRLVLDLVDHLRTPWSDVWRLEALARGRIRRWARWEVDGPEATHRAIASVSAALEAGRIPEPEGAVLVEVVDQRPAGAHRRSAGLGVVRPAG
jgi:hypothetical protein